jgi:hypothetical protein
MYLRVFLFAVLATPALANDFKGLVACARALNEIVPGVSSSGKNLIVVPRASEYRADRNDRFLSDAPVTDKDFVIVPDATRKNEDGKEEKGFYLYQEQAFRDGNNVFSAQFYPYPAASEAPEKQEGGRHHYFKIQPLPLFYPDPKKDKTNIYLRMTFADAFPNPIFDFDTPAVQRETSPDTFYSDEKTKYKLLKEGYSTTAESKKLLVDRISKALDYLGTAEFEDDKDTATSTNLQADAITALAKCQKVKLEAVQKSYASAKARLSPAAESGARLPASTHEKKN